MQTDNKNIGIVQSFTSKISQTEIIEVMVKKCNEYRVPITEKNLKYIWESVLKDVIPEGVEMIIEEEMNKAKAVEKK